MMKTLGILGAGHLASYTVAGLRNSGDDRKIIVSPRNTRTAATLADEYGCEIGVSNQHVIDKSEIILLSVRPQHVESLLEGLVFRPNQLVLSAMAGISTRQLQVFPALAGNRIFRTLPSVCAEVGSGPVPLFPGNNDIRALLSGLGVVVEFGDESTFNLATVHGVMHGWVYYWLDEIVQWTVHQGMEPEQAQTMVKQIVMGAIDFSDARPESLKQIGDSIATDGTYTRAGYEFLHSRNALTDWTDALEMIAGKLEDG